MAQKWPQAVTEVSDMLVLKFLVEHGHDKVAKKFEAARNVPDIGGLFSLRLEGLLDFFAEETSTSDRKRKQGLVGSGKVRGTSSLKTHEVSSALDSESSTSEEETDEEDLDQVVEYSQLFEDNKNQILQVLPNLTKGMDLTKVVS